MKGLSFDDLYPGRFIKAGDLKGREITVQIADVNVEELEGGEGKKTKGVVSFAGKKKAFVLNRTNGECIKAMFGRDVDAWIGKRITLYPTEFNGEPCIRIKGSPDLSAPVTFELKLPKKKPKATTMVVTGKPAGKAPTPAPVPQSVQEAADELGGTIDDVPQHDEASIPF